VITPALAHAGHAHAETWLYLLAPLGTIAFGVLSYLAFRLTRKR
jgi:hypothetical protein